MSDAVMTNYNIPTEILNNLRLVHDGQGPRAALKYFIKRTEGRQVESLETRQVEDFAIAFYTKYNATFGLTY